MSCLKQWPNRVLLAALVLLLCVAPLAAQDEAVGPSASARKPPETLIELIIAGGPLNIAFLSVLGFCSLVALAVIIERLVNLTENKLAPWDFVRGLRELIARQHNDDPQIFRDLCGRHPSPIADILKAGLARAGRPVPEAEKAMEDAAIRELSVLRSKVRPLTVLSSAAPLIGLLGTAVGMILVFRTASQVGPGKAELLAEGIYLKLETTVAGLIVAIPSVLFGAILNSRSEKLMRRIESYVMETIPCFIRMEENAEERSLTSSGV